VSEMEDLERLEAQLADDAVDAQRIARFYGTLTANGLDHRAALDLTEMWWVDLDVDGEEE
jgi:hypothetical protein